MSKFCANGDIINPKCYSIEDLTFNSEEDLLTILLDVLKSELPVRLREVPDCRGDKTLEILEKHIDLIPTSDSAHLSVILNPLGDSPKYAESRHFREVEYSFEAILTVQNSLPECLTWELIRFKNVVEGLLLGAELAIDGYDSVYTELKGFTYSIPEVGDGLYSRQGAYRFTVTVTQCKINNN